MDKYLLEKLKSKLNAEYVSSFSIEYLKKEKFIPINRYNDIFYVGIVDILPAIKNIMKFCQ